MTMKLPCAVIRDLLPLYAERMTEPETKMLVEEHLERCEECRQKLSDIKKGAVTPVETAKPLKTLKREIRKRRRYSALIAALLVFVVLFTVFYHENKWELVPWQNGLIEVDGVETRPSEEVYADADASGKQGPNVDVLVLQVDAIVNGTHESMFIDDDGTRTVILQAWNASQNSKYLIKEYNELILCPVPDRLIYSVGAKQELLWGEPMNGGVEVLPRLALAFYVLVAAGSALILGIIWLFLRKRDRSWIPRQLFFAPVSYLIAHFLIKGIGKISYFIEKDFISIVLIAAALYALLSLAWQIWLQRRREAS